MPSTAAGPDAAASLARAAGSTQSSTPALHEVPASTAGSARGITAGLGRPSAMRAFFARRLRRAVQ